MLSQGSTFDAWLASRAVPGSKGLLLTPGGRRQLSFRNAMLAFEIAQEAAPKVLRMVWGRHRLRAVILLSLNLARGVFPALRGYSQALIINEIQTAFSTGRFDMKQLPWLLAREFTRMTCESALDSLINSTERVVYNSARLEVEYRQMQLQLQLDIPTLSDPLVRDVVHESDLFVRSFAQSGAGGFGLLSPLDVVRLLTLICEVVSHVFIIYSLARTSPSHSFILLITAVIVLFPHIVSWLRMCSRPDNDDAYNPQEAAAAAKLEKMRNLAYSETHRREILAWDLAPWILRCWDNARRTMLGLEQMDSDLFKEFSFAALFAQLQLSLADILAVSQNIPLLLMLQSSGGSLGSVALYRNSVQGLVYTIREFLSTFRMLAQSVFLMGAFSAAMDIRPRLRPAKCMQVPYRSLKKGMRIEARNLCYTYPGCVEPALKGVSFKLEPGERLAIVGHNGSGKSTLAQILTRILDFDSGELLVNDVDIRRYCPNEYHRHISSIFQGFSKFNASVAKNVGVGYIGNVDNHGEIHRAVKMAGASHIVDSLPRGLKTRLDASGSDSAYPQLSGWQAYPSSKMNHGLSGGEWQHIALSRAFMRADRPEVNLLVLDEPTSSLDAHAQNRTFDAVEKISSGPHGRTKTVIFITHRLCTARRADKIAYMQNGTIVEFGTHQELLDRKGAYAALHYASI
ncbi:P-loop containing nucleoside triphosphate hydrolase protein [Gloeophyllum trabeum ATCC 11539]|uniref:p-loop containing nucleoside triphosphate hydrolase protein n=1 Tax=Gloeophyllum trabeum (strain ATCC 11539 / FP-39264 / Madison 617) TaxID=670483 RepID=S7S1L6_GLOTA|nr:P-loop containing nucleoside triphosphate hydrolase protein [Gloeophyllum trabeum ATCC 11539]EPQ59659.1 P-loop containing nucleoside triphosphate hydrolase protein [Gloeophyllum trabeum ATCC 11539]